MRSKWTWPLIAALALVVALGAASCGGGNNNNSSSGNTTSTSATSSSATGHSDVLAALVLLWSSQHLDNLWRLEAHLAEHANAAHLPSTRAGALRRLGILAS